MICCFSKENIRVSGDSPFSKRIRSIINEYPYWTLRIEKNKMVELSVTTKTKDDTFVWTYYLLPCPLSDFNTPNKTVLLIDCTSIHMTSYLILNTYSFQSLNGEYRQGTIL